jgi:DNA-directed RNA polymerase subunit RPC12/RpoP
MAQADGTNANGPEGMLTLVCINCGKELFFTTKPPKDNEPCPKCGGTVFRSFFTPTVRDDATEAMLEDTSRSIALDSAPTDSPKGDLRDLNNL